MSIKVEYRDGVFAPLEALKGVRPGMIYRVFSFEELRSLCETVSWLTASETSFEFWNNEADAVYDTL